uniref:DNA helicase n=1 Tax=uncultured euryarchaeote Alv-FOS1 TaxID=337892 RepID=Q3SAC5_9EURY|nr:DNA replication licensing factor MCM related protein [uncultured euryarchaeote Alv-FOS1]
MDYTDDEIKGIWEEFLSQSEYSIKLLEVNDKYPYEKSLYVDFEDLVVFQPDFSEYVMEQPEKCLELGEAAIQNYLNTNHHIHLRIIKISDNFKMEIRKLRTTHIGKFVAIRGIIRRASEVRPKLKIGAFKCSDCGGINYEEQPGNRLVYPDKCEICGKPKGKIKFHLVPEDSVFEDFQVVEVQDTPESLRGGEQPQRITAVLKDDIAGTLVPGDRVIVNGIIKAQEVRIQNLLSTEFRMFLDINSIDREEKDLSTEEITEEDIEEIKELARDPEAIEKLKNSIAPTIYGMDTIKEALVLQMFGGVPKTMPDGTKIRGDIHVLLVGDPGTAKSQLLSKMAQLAPRGIYTSGKGSSAAGLTATAVRDETGRWTLEAGALVLADLGLAAIDEMDKMSTTDRDSIYQAMEQQIITVTKAGIYATLMSRCSVLGAANPKYGRFDPQSSIPNQIDLPVPLLSRFDVIFKILDTPNPNRDKATAEHILKVHLVGEKLSLGEEDIIVEQHLGEISPELLRKYVIYAKEHVIPKLSDDALKRISEEYLKMRGMYSDENQRVAITPRQLEAMIRLAEASARARLSDVVTTEDAKRAIRIVKEYMKDASSEDGQPDADILSSGTSSSTRQLIFSIKRFIEEYSAETMDAPYEKEVIEEFMGRNFPKHKIIEAIEKLRRGGEIIRDTRGRLRIA